MLELLDIPENSAEFAAALDQMHGLPARGAPVGKGPHCCVPESWDGTGPPPPGWTTHAGCLTTTGLLVPDAQVVADGDKRIDKLTGQERAAYVKTRAKLKDASGDTEPRVAVTCAEPRDTTLLVRIALRAGFRALSDDPLKCRLYCTVQELLDAELLPSERFALNGILDRSTQQELNTHATINSSRNDRSDSSSRSG